MNKTILTRLNSVTIATGEFFDLTEATERWTRENPDIEADGMTGMFLLARQYKGDPVRAQAVYFRMAALARMLTAGEAHGWTLPTLPDGSIPTREEVLAVAATHPLSMIGEEIGFVRETFLAEVLRRTEAEGEA